MDLKGATVKFSRRLKFDRTLEVNGVTTPIVIAAVRYVGLPAGRGSD